MTDTTTPIDFAAMEAQLQAMSEQISRASRQLEELRRTEIADRVSALGDGFWLAQARMVLMRLRNEMQAGKSDYYDLNVWNITNDLDRIIERMDYLNQKKEPK